MTFSKEGNSQTLPPPDGSGQTGWLLFPRAAEISEAPGLTKQPRTLASRRDQRTRQDRCGPLRLLPGSDTRHVHHILLAKEGLLLRGDSDPI